MEIEIIYNSKVEDFLFDLTYILFKEEYFGFFESSKDYVLNLIVEIETHLELSPHRRSPKQLQKHGKFYITFNTTQPTTWYIFFDKNNNRYFVEFITNNHAPNAEFFNEI